MVKFRFLILAVFLTFAFVVGCSGGADDTPLTPTDEGRTAVENPDGTACMGFWQVVIDKASGDIDIADLRAADAIINVLGFVEPPALKGMTIDFGTLEIADPIIEVDVILTHPIPDAVFMGFDVRGVVFGPEVANADGLTVIPSPEFFSGEAFGYMDGLLGAPDSVANYEGLAGYKYFCDGLGATADLATFFEGAGNMDDRGVFSESPTQHTRHYTLDWADSAEAFFVFNYAIYANYDWPIGDPVDNVDDFDISTANSREAFCARFTENSNGLYYSGGSGGGVFNVDIKVWDWQGIDDTAHTVEFWSSDLGVSSAIAATYVGPGTEASTGIWNCDGTGTVWTPAGVGFATLLVKVIDPETFGDAWFMNLLSPGNSLYGANIYNVFPYELEIVDCPPVEVLTITPVGGNTGASIPGTAITGNGFSTGTCLEVKLEMGAEEIVATNLNVVDASNITCDISIPADPTLVGLWDVVVTSGCCSQGTLVDGFEIKSLYSEHFDSDPGSDWYKSNYQYWSGCTQGTPAWGSGAPYGQAAGALQCSGTPTWGTLAGGGICTMVSPPFDCPTATEVILRVRAMWDLGGSYPSYTCIRFYGNNGPSPGLSPFSTTGVQGSSTILLNTTAHGGVTPPGWGGGTWGEISGAGWSDNFNNWPTNITNYVDLVVPVQFHGDADFKFAFMTCPDWCGYPGTGTGIVLDDVEILTF